MVVKVIKPKAGRIYELKFTRSTLVALLASCALDNFLCEKRCVDYLSTWVCWRYEREWEGCGGAWREQEVNEVLWSLRILLTRSPNKTDIDMVHMVHMVQTIAVKDRAVFLLNNPPVIHLRELTGGDLMPTQDDHLCLSSKPCYVLCSRYGQSTFQIGRAHVWTPVTL